MLNKSRTLRSGKAASDSPKSLRSQIVTSKHQTHLGLETKGSWVQILAWWCAKHPGNDGHCSRSPTGGAFGCAPS